MSFPTRWLRRALPLLPLAVVLWVYLHAAHVRRAENPRDKLMPLPSDVAEAVSRACTTGEFSETVPIVEDLKSSLRLFGLGFGAAVVFSLAVGLPIGFWGWANATFDPLLRLLSYLPPITLLPLVMLTLGIGDLAKCFLIFVAVAIPLTRSLILRVQAINEHQVWNAQTLGPSAVEMLWIVVRRIVEPGFLNDARLLIGTAWVYLIAAELIASNAGLGYRINVASRNLDLAMIFFYIAVVCALAFGMDKMILFLNRWKNRWAFHA